MLKKLGLVIAVLAGIGFIFGILTAAAALVTLPAGDPDPGAVPGEPACYGSLWMKNCHGQDMYRQVYNATATPTVDNVRAAVLGAYAPVQASASWNNKLNTAVESQYLSVTTETASCYRDATLGFIVQNTEDRKVSDEVAVVMDLALDQYGRAAPKEYEVGLSELTNLYSDVLKAGVNMALSEAAYAQATGDFGICQ